jgi:hypothetical protein
VPRLLASIVIFIAVPVLLLTNAWSGDWDLNLARLCRIQTRSGSQLECGGGYSSSIAESDPLVKVIPDNASFRSLMSELGAVFAPNLLTPADTRGYAGFSFGTQLGWTSINPQRYVLDQNTKEARPYWRAARSVNSSAFSDPGQFNEAQVNAMLPSNFAPTITVMAQKGLWVPVPSFELGLGARHLIGSHLWSPLVTAKIALHEGFHDWPIPSVAVRGSGAHLLGASGFNLSLAGLDFSLSKQIGIASLFNLTPYTGYQLLWIIADSEVLDATPAIDPMVDTSTAAQGNPLKLNQCWAADCVGDFSFANQSNITRHRFFIGMRANFYLVSLSLEYTYFASGGKSDEIATAANMPGLVIPDGSGSQHSVSVAVSLDY